MIKAVSLYTLGSKQQYIRMTEDQTNSRLNGSFRLVLRSGGGCLALSI